MEKLSILLSESEQADFDAGRQITLEVNLDSIVTLNPNNPRGSVFGSEVKVVTACIEGNFSKKRRLIMSLERKAIDS